MTVSLTVNVDKETMQPHITLANRRIGPSEPIYVVAELSANHGQSLETALELVRAAHASGADAVKIQTLTPEGITLNSASELFRVGQGSLWSGRTLYDLYQEAQTPWEWHAALQSEAVRLGIHLFSSPFDLSAIDFLERLEMPAYKIASFELVDLALIERAALTGKPLILSTGMASREEIEEAIMTARRAGANQIVLLKCTSAYPAAPEAMNLRAIASLADAFGVPVGLSDHTLGIAVPVAAAALGACLIEKHLTLSREVPGPDSAFSLEPQEFKAMVESVRIAQVSLGKPDFGRTPAEQDSVLFRRSLFAVQDIPVGDPLTPDNVRSIRPGHGLPPRHLPEVLGRHATEYIAMGTPLSWEIISGMANASLVS